MKRWKLVLLLVLMAGLLSGCGPMVVEDAGTVQIGAAYVRLFT